MIQINIRLFLLSFFLLIFFTNPIFTYLAPREVIVLLTFLVSVICLLYSVRSINILAITIFILMIASIATHDVSTLNSDISYLLVFISVFFLLMSFGDKLILQIVNVIYFMAFFSIIVWVPMSALLFFGIDPFDLFKDIGLVYRESIAARDNGRLSLFFINIGENSFRNRGMSWEPAIFAQIIFLGILLVEFLKYKDYKISNKYIIIFVITILTTLSTGGYIILFIYILLFKLNLKNNPVYFIFGIPLGIYMFINLDFLGLKTTLQFAQASDISSIGFYQGRFNALYIFQQLLASPLFGIGTNTYLDSIFMSSGTTWNGYLDLLLSFGIIFFLYFNYLLCLSVKKIIGVKYLSYDFLKFIIIIVMLMNLSNLFNTPLFYIIPMWGLVSYNSAIRDLR